MFQDSLRRLLQVVSILDGVFALCRVDLYVFFLWHKKGWGQARLQTLVPIDNLQAKLEIDFDKEKERAERTAKNMVQSAMRKNQNRERQEAKKKQKQQKNQSAVEVKPEDALQNEINAHQEELRKIQCQEDEEKQVQAAIAAAVAKCKPRTSIPLTILMQTEAVEKSARAKAMQEAMKRAEEKLQQIQTGLGSLGTGSALGGDVSSSVQGGQETAVGIQAVLHALRETGSLPQKKIIKGKKDDKAMTATEMKKLGKHLLK